MKISGGALHRATSVRKSFRNSRGQRSSRIQTEIHQVLGYGGSGSAPASVDEEGRVAGPNVTGKAETTALQLTRDAHVFP